MSEGVTRGGHRLFSTREAVSDAGKERRPNCKSWKSRLGNVWVRLQRQWKGDGVLRGKENTGRMTQAKQTRSCFVCRRCWWVAALWRQVFKRFGGVRSLLNACRWNLKAGSRSRSRSNSNESSALSLRFVVCLCVVWVCLRLVDGASWLRSLDCLGLNSAVGAESVETLEEYLSGLRRRELYTVAEGYCLRKLKETDLPQDQRVTLVLELSRTYADHASRARNEREREELWKQAEQVLNEEQKRVQDENLRLALQVQRSLTRVARGDFCRWQWELAPLNLSLKKQAIDLLEDAVAQLKQQEKLITSRLATGSTPGQTVLSGRLLKLLRSLQFHVRHALLQALLDLAVLLDESSADRTSVLLEAERWAKRLDSGVLTRQAKAERNYRLAMVFRLQHRYAEAERALKAAARDAPQALSNDLVTEQARLLLAQDRVADAAQLLTQHSQKTGLLTGEQRYLLVRALLGMWQLASAQEDRTLASQLLRQASAQIQQISDDPYWNERARQLFNQLTATNQLGPEVASLVRRAKAFYSLKNWKAAVAAYQQAAQEARKAHQTDTAFELAYTAASIQLQQGELDAALQSLDQLVQQTSSSSQAAQAHWLKIIALAAQLKQAETLQARTSRTSHPSTSSASQPSTPAPQNAQAAQKQPSPFAQTPSTQQAAQATSAAAATTLANLRKVRAEYQRALEEHRRRFRNSPTYYEATWLLALWKEAQGETLQALRLYEEIPSENKHADEARLRTVLCYQKLLNTLEPNHLSNIPAGNITVTRLSRQRLQNECLQTLKRFIRSLPPSPQQWSKAQVRWVIEAAAVLLAFQPPAHQLAEQWLNQAVTALQTQAHPNATSSRVATQTEQTGSKNETKKKKAQTENTEQLPVELIRRAAQLQIVCLTADGQVEQARRLLERLPSSPPDNLLNVLLGLADLATHTDTQTRQQIGRLQLEASERLLNQLNLLPRNQQTKLLKCRAQGFLLTNQPDKAVEVYQQLLQEHPHDTSLLRTAAQVCLQSQKPETLRKGIELWQRVSDQTTPGSDAWFECRYHLAECCYRLGDYDSCLKVLVVATMLYGSPSNSSLRQKIQHLAELCKKNKDTKHKRSLQPTDR